MYTRDFIRQSTCRKYLCTLAPLSHLCPSLAVVCSVTKVAMISVRCFSLIREPAVLKAPLRACSIVRRRPGSSVFCRNVYRCRCNTNIYNIKQDLPILFLQIDEPSQSNTVRLWVLGFLRIENLARY